MLINGFDFKFGADPEIFLKDDKDNLVSAYGLIPGNKKKPHIVDLGAVQVDGMALEFNIDPATNYEEWEKNLSSVISILGEMIPKDHKFYFEATAEFGKEYIESQVQEARELGCDPDYNAYTKEVNAPPNGDLGFRTAAGHIHIGWTENVNPLDPNHFDACINLTKVMDAYLGVPSVIEDKDVKRRELYGRAGAFRPKPYGMEYRVLSNYWLKSKRMRKEVFKRSIQSIYSLFKWDGDGKKASKQYLKAGWPPIKHDADKLINNNMREDCIRAYKNFHNSWLDEHYGIG